MVYLLKKPKHGKMDNEYVGPCEIIEMNYNTHNAKIRKGENTQVVHMDLLKHSYEMTSQIPQRSSINSYKETQMDDGE